MSLTNPSYYIDRWLLNFHTLRLAHILHYLELVAFRAWVGTRNYGRIALRKYHECRRHKPWYICFVHIKSTHFMDTFERAEGLEITLMDLFYRYLICIVYFVRSNC